MEEKKTLRTVKDARGEICYGLVRKKVKNINLRVYPDGSVTVSANSRVSLRYLDNFVISKADFIRAAWKKYAQIEKNRKNIQELPECDREKFLEYIQSLCRRWYPAFASSGVPYPQIRIRKMKSRWGSCQPERGVVTFSTMLYGVPEAAAEYVIVHEFAHFLVPNHSAQFYAAVTSVMPDWKERKAMLNTCSCIQ